MALVLFLFISCFLVTNYVVCIFAMPPHIIYILGDDLGWNDLSYHGSNQILTPNIDSLAYNGVILNRYYTQPLCTPSRASLMTGRYPIHTGQHTATRGFQRSGLPLSIKIMPQYFKDLGYTTHIIGKWHLGFYKKEYTPLGRGFDSHFGYWSGFISYYDHIHEVSYGKGLNRSNFCGYDLRRGDKSAWDVEGQYATDIFTKEAVNLIEKHPVNKPMFLYISHLAVHSGNEGNLLEAPREKVKNLSYITNPNRRTYAAMVTKLDESVGEVIKALGARGMLKNSVIVFASDNGPPNSGTYRNWGSCYPFRGQKGSLWEGGVRAPAMIWSPLINRPSRVSDGLMHITDWLPTLLGAAGSRKEIREIDGVNQWYSIANGYPNPRDNLVLDIYDAEEMNGYITGPFKYVKGVRGSQSEDCDNYLNFDTIFSKNAPNYNIKKITSSPAWTALQRLTKGENSVEKIQKLRKESTVTCRHESHNNTIDCQHSPCLFNIIEDQCEQVNVAEVYPILTKHIENILNDLRVGKYPEDLLINDPLANPDLFNGTWSSWSR